MTEERAKYQLNGEPEQRTLSPLARHVYHELFDNLLKQLADQPALLVEHMSHDQARAMIEEIKQQYPSIL